MSFGKIVTHTHTHTHTHTMKYIKQETTFLGVLWYLDNVIHKPAKSHCNTMSNELKSMSLLAHGSSPDKTFFVLAISDV